MNDKQKNRVTVVPYVGPRIETGAVQFGDDWPGVFVRGDNALLGLLPALKVAFEAMPKEDFYEAYYAQFIGQLIADIESCHARGLPRKEIVR